MIPSLSIGPRTLLNDCNHSATAIFWRSAINGGCGSAQMRPSFFEHCRASLSPCRQQLLTARVESNRAPRARSSVMLTFYRFCQYLGHHAD